MIDSAKIYVQAGDGGYGCASFKGVKFSRSRRPDGGKGGKGADVIIKVDKAIQTLERFRFKQHFQAEKGKLGQANKKKGADGRPYIIKVPSGTVIRDLENDLLLRELINDAEQIVVAKGGRGGRANTKEETATEGLPGEGRHLALELKLVVDVGIVGYPNAGKSSILARISRARPKIADYPFTTTSPYLGVVEFKDWQDHAKLIFVEIPGIIEGSHHGKGLGLHFLRHAERAKVLIHLIDMAYAKAKKPFEDYQSLNQQLQFYNPLLLRKPQVLVANKMDLPEAKNNLGNFSAKVKKEVYPISSVTGEGINGLLKHIRDHFRDVSR